MEISNIQAADVVGQCCYGNDLEIFDKGMFKELLIELPYDFFNACCIDVLRLEYHHHISVGKWCTESPGDFREGELNFYTILYDVDADQLPDTGYWEFIDKARISPRLFSKHKLLSVLALISDTVFYYFCNNILKLQLHKDLVSCFYFTDEPDEVRKKILFHDQDDPDLLFQLRSINRKSPIPFERS